MRLIAIAALSSSLLVGCSGSSGPSLSLSAKGGSTSTLSASPVATSSASSALGAGSGIFSPAAPSVTSPDVRIERVRIVIGSLELGTTTAFGDDSSNAAEVVRGPFVIDLSQGDLAGGIKTLFSTDSVRSDRYAYARFDLRPLGADEARRYPDLAGASVRVDGTVDLAPFTFDSGLATTIVRDGRFDFLGEDMNITLVVDPANWFKNGTTVLDPRVDANRPLIEARIAEVLALFGDHDLNGWDDVGEGHLWGEGIRRE